MGRQVAGRVRGRATIKSLFTYSQATALRLLLLVLLSMALMTLDHRGNYLERVRALVATLVYPVQALVHLPVSAGSWLGENLASRETLLEENTRLRSQNAILKGQLQKLISLELENMRLRKLLDSSQQVGERVLVAELVAVDLDPFTRQVLINKGSLNDVYRGQPVLDAEGVFGQVVHVAPLTSVVLLISDPSHALPVQVARNGLRAIAEGTGDDTRLALRHIPNNADIRVGDLLTTSGLGGVFPTGYPVAEVAEVRPDNTQPYATVVATPLAHLDRAREVLLVWPDDPAAGLPDPIAEDDR